MILDNVTLSVYIVCSIVILLFAIAFIWIAALYFNAKKKLYEKKVEDEAIQKDVDRDYEQILKKKRADETPVAYYERKQKGGKIFNRISNVILIVIYVCLLGFIGYQATLKVKGDQVFINHQAGLVIQTNSMATVDPTNKADLEKHGLLSNENRIQEYAYITISNDPNVLANIKEYDVVAFKMPSLFSNAAPDAQMTIVHRVIKITKGSDGKRLFTFRGDANPGSMSNEINVTEDRLVGVYSSSLYKGKYNLGWGYFIVYIQSPIGIITLVIAFLLLIIYSILFEKLLASYNARYIVLLGEKLSPVQTVKKEIVLVPSPKTFIAESPSIIELKEKKVLPALPLKPGFYISDKVKNKQSILSLQKSIYKMNEYVYSGFMSKGKVDFAIFQNGKLQVVPLKKDFNYGYTFEGLADKIFKVENALRCRSDKEKRSFVYINKGSYLTFIGDPNVEYNLYIRLFDNEFNENNDRWIVVYAEEKEVNECE